MKILLYGDHYTLTTGYARIFRDLLPFLKKDNEVRQVSLDWNGLPLSDDIKCYPTNIPSVKEYWGQEVLSFALSDFQPDIVLSIQDFYVTRKIAFDLSQPGSWKWVHYGTLDGSPLDYSCREAMRWVDYVLYFSEFAKKEVLTVFADMKGEVVYPPINPVSFHQLNKKELKKKYGLEGRKVLLNCGRNQQRKNVPVLLDALEVLVKKMPEIVLVLASTAQTRSTSGQKDGYDLDAFIKDRKLEDHVLVPPQMDELPISDELLNELYNLADVMVHSSWGEGYGLIISEIGASKIPTIAVDHSAVTEVVGKGGILVKPSAYAYDQRGTRYHLVRPEGLVDAVEEFYGLGEQEINQLGEYAYQKTMKLKPEKVAEQMLDAFKKVIDHDITAIAKS